MIRIPWETRVFRIGWTERIPDLAYLLAGIQKLDIKSQWEKMHSGQKAEKYLMQALEFCGFFGE